MTQIVVGTGGEMKANGAIFDSPNSADLPSQIDLTDGSVVKANDLTNNIFNVSLYTPIGDVRYLTNNKSFDDVYINPGNTLSSGQSVTLTAMGASTANLVYILAGDLTIKKGATLAVAKNVAVGIGTGTQLTSLTLTDDGKLTFASGDKVTFNPAFLVTTQILVGKGALMSANLTTVDGTSTLYTTQIVVQSEGQLVATGSSFTVMNLSNAGTVSLTNSTLTVSGTVAQLSETSLTTGTWIIADRSSLYFPSNANITELTGAKVTLNGSSSNFAALANLAKIGSVASLSLLGGQSFTTVGDLSSAGSVILNNSKLNVAGNLSNTASVNLTDSTLNVSGSVKQLSGTSLTAGTWIIANSGLNFASGSSITALSGAKVTLSGANSKFAALAKLNTIASGSSLSLLGGRNFTTVGNLSNAGSLVVSGGTLNDKGNLSNPGTINLSTATLSIAGTVAQLSSNALTAGKWIVGPSSNLNFAAGSKITSLAGAQVTLNGANSNFVALANLNTIAAGSIFEIAGGQSFTTVGDLSSAAGIIVSTATLNVTGSLNNTGGVILSTATLNVAGNMSNTGRVNLSDSTLNVKGTVAQLSSSNALTAGTWNVGPSSNLNFAAGSKITSLAGAQVTLNGVNSNFAALASLSSIAHGSSLSLLGGQSFTTAGNFTNNGTLTVGAGSILTATGSFTQASNAALNVQLGGSNSAPTFGQVVSTSGTVSLGGTLKVTSTVVPAVNSLFEILANKGGSPISGAFASLAEGSKFTVTSGSTTMTFQISYKGAGGNNVSITRIS
jgi:formylmethanofuran dehydrogenase subunit C